MTGRSPCVRSRLRFQAALLAMLAAACSRPPGPLSGGVPAPATPALEGLTLRDWPSEPCTDPADAGAPRLRIVSAAPSVTEICCALGLCDQLVGRTRYCVHPPGVSDVPSIGALLDTNVEALLALKPDLVILAGTSRLMADRLAPLPLRIESVPDAALEDIWTSVRRVGELTGRRRSAQRLIDGIRAELDAVVLQRKRRDAPRVLIVPGVLATPPAPPTVAGPGSFYDDLLKLGGLRNAAPEGHRGFAALSLEALTRIDPDVIIELDPDGRARPGGHADALAAWSAVGPLHAVRERRVFVLCGGEHYLPGPRIAGTLHAICTLVDGPPGAAGDGTR
ncbi:MAG: helical backbone metal receptor [Phycisphaerae bacterium]|nr:ABC transporter substrate-binding protein [Phycisphaerae bacterium]MCZ2401287.1 helical backbone metal receptor [Phycisphaerae bacterium]